MEDAEGENAEGENAEVEIAERETAEGETDTENEQTLDLPFPFSALDVALERKYSFDGWDSIIECASYLGIVFPENVILVSKLVTLEIVRASGVNPFHFHEASFFTTMLSNHDTRFMCIDPVELERLYWLVVRSNTNLEHEIKRHLGNDAYYSTVKKARELRTQYTNPHRHMTSLGRVAV
jgi:hypothetical protein